jgi:hypothetical protein
MSGFAGRGPTGAAGAATAASSAVASTAPSVTRGIIAPVAGAHGHGPGRNDRRFDYLLSPLDRGARSELLHMMGLVAAVVAIVILVFFGLGYLFGRLFL